MRNKLVSSALVTAFAASICAYTPAHALEAKQCLPMAQMNAALKAEGQRTMIIADRSALQTPTGKLKDADVLRFVNTVTSNADGSLGYQLEGDKPRTQESTQACVRARLTNVRLFDKRKPGPNEAVLLGGAFNDMIRENEKIGTRPMVLADTVHRSANGTERLGSPLAIMGNAYRGGGAIVALDKDGTPLRLAVLSDTDYTPAGLERVRGVALASLRAPN